MRLNDLKISRQLYLGLGTILLLVAVFSGQAWLQTSRLWDQTEGLYEHPLTVARALGELEVDVECMSRHVRDLFLAQDEPEAVAALQCIEIRKANAARQFAVLDERYLGPREDVAALNDAFLKWNVLRDETVRLLRAGKTGEAEARIRPSGVQAAQLEAVSRLLQKIDDYARERGDRFYAEAKAQRQTIHRQLGGFAGAILLLCLAAGGLLVRSIRTPLAALTAVTQAFRKGQLESRSDYVSANEFGTLSASFNAMADALQAQTRLDQQTAQLAGIMLREEESHAFFQELLKALLQQTGSQVGAVYLLNEAKTAFEHFESVGLDAGGRAAFSAAEREGELGAAVATRMIQLISDIPADTRLTFRAASGVFLPREILTLPVLAGPSVSAVISLASVRAYPEPALRLVNDSWSMLNARVNGVLALRKIREIAARLEQQNQELAAQKRELAAQAGELTGQNIELEMQKAQLDEANRLKSAFLSNMSHELRTPLNSVIALSGVLYRRLAKTLPEEEYGYLEVIERNGRSLLALINDILDLARIEAGKEELSVSRFSVRGVVDELVAMLQPQALEKGVALVSQVGDDLAPLASDGDKCRHILQNLLGNAVKFTERGRVTVTARQAGQELQIAVADTGIGIAAGQLPYIFDEFRQADDSTARIYGGTGLGLAIAKKYATLLGGAITVESTLGQGSTFTLRLPLSPEGLPLPEPAARPAAPVPPGRDQNILVVEDNEPAIIQLTDMLCAEGYRVQVARNGREALEQIAQLLPDAMILDLMMPEVDGFQVLKAIRSTERAGQLPVLILTAKHVTREELSFLKGNHIHQLIQKGDINRAGLLAEVARMVAPPAPPPHPPLPRRRPARPGKPVVLVVEDNPDNLRTARALLGGRVQVIEAADGQAGVEQARQHRPDLILTDIALPVLDGFGELEALRQSAELRHIPVIAVTASAMKGNREEILARGFDGYISKPIDHDELWRTLHEFLEWEDGDA